MKKKNHSGGYVFVFVISLRFNLSSYTFKTQVHFSNLLINRLGFVNLANLKNHF